PTTPATSTSTRSTAMAASICSRATTGRDHGPPGRGSRRRRASASAAPRAAACSARSAPTGAAAGPERRARAAQPQAAAVGRTSRRTRWLLPSTRKNTVDSSTQGPVVASPWVPLGAAKSFGRAEPPWTQTCGWGRPPPSCQRTVTTLPPPSQRSRGVGASSRATPSTGAEEKDHSGRPILPSPRTGAAGEVERGRVELQGPAFARRGRDVPLRQADLHLVQDRRRRTHRGRLRVGPRVVGALAGGQCDERDEQQGELPGHGGGLRDEG